MGVTDLYAKRKKQAEKTEPDVFSYDALPHKLRIQIGMVLLDAIGPYWRSHGDYMGSPPAHNNDAWEVIHETMCREFGQRSLGASRDLHKNCDEYLLNHPDVDEVLSLIELCARVIAGPMSKLSRYELKDRGVKQLHSDAIKEMNTRFRESAVGYSFENGKIIRVDSDLLHTETVKPALQLLNDARFKGAEQEFLSAHAHFRMGEHKDAIIDALNSIESVLKSICEIRGWNYQKGARATDLIKIARANNLFSDYLENSFDQLLATLSSGLPKVRNEEGGHGQGTNPRSTPEHVAAYALHLAASKIVFLVSCLKSLEKES